MNPPSQPPADYPRPVREVFAGMGVPEHILAEQERMDDLFAAHFGKPGLDQPMWIDSSDRGDGKV
jgi:hypothetical protein